MNINDLVTLYVTFRRTLGERCNRTEYALRAFCRAIGPATAIRRIRSKAVAQFVVGNGSAARTCHFRYTALKGFFKFAVSRGYVDKAPLPTVLPKYGSSFVPYIYSRAEIRRLLDAIPSYHPFPSRIEPNTLRALLLLLYGAGLRRGEALRLSVGDVDLSNSLLIIRDSKFFKSRLVPISSELTKVLRDYAGWRTTTHPSTKTDSPFFVTRRGTAIPCWNVQSAFERLRDHAGVQRTDGSRYQPRLHDLRHTFAVHRLTAWYQQGADVQRLVYDLSVYLGHAHLTHTQVYLTLTPELLEQAGRRFERYARGEENHA
jgi:integrase/recombinase XerD